MLLIGFFLFAISCQSASALTNCCINAVARATAVVLDYVHVGSAQPRSTYMWSEYRRLALEISELTPALLSNNTRPVVAVSATTLPVRDLPQQLIVNY